MINAQRKDVLATVKSAERSHANYVTALKKLAKFRNCNRPTVTPKFSGSSKGVQKNTNVVVLVPGTYFLVNSARSKLELHQCKSILLQPKTWQRHQVVFPKFRSLRATFHQRCLHRVSSVHLHNPLGPSSTVPKQIR